MNLLESNPNISHLEIANCPNVTIKTLSNFSNSKLRFVNLKNCTGIAKEDLIDWLKNIAPPSNELEIKGIDGEIQQSLKKEESPKDEKNHNSGF